MSQQTLCKNQVSCKLVRVRYFCVDLTWNDPIAFKDYKMKELFITIAILAGREGLRHLSGNHAASTDWIRGLRLLASARYAQ